MKEEQKYYNYILCDTQKIDIFQYDCFLFNTKPFYVGKGQRDRCFDHMKKLEDEHNFHKSNILKKMFKNNCPPVIMIFPQKNEKSALENEINLIEKIGLSNLANISIGGCGGNTYKYLSEEKLTEVINRIKNIRNDNEFKEKMSKIFLEKWRDEEFKKKMSEIHLERWEDEEFRKKHKESMRNYFDNRSDEEKEDFIRKCKKSQVNMSKESKESRRIKCSNMDKSYMKTDEYRRKISESHTNKLLREVEPYLDMIKERYKNLESNPKNRRKGKDSKTKISKDFNISTYRLQKVFNLIDNYKI